MKNRKYIAKLLVCVLFSALALTGCDPLNSSDRGIVITSFSQVPAGTWKNNEIRKISGFSLTRNGTLVTTGDTSVTDTVVVDETSMITVLSQGSGKTADEMWELLKAADTSPNTTYSTGSPYIITSIQVYTDVYLQNFTVTLSGNILTLRQPEGNGVIDSTIYIKQ